MSFTYSQLKTAIQDYLESTETSLVSNLNNFIETAEERILKNVQLDEFRKNVEGEFSTSSPYLTTPDDYLAPFSLSVIDGNGDYTFLLLKQVSFIRDFSPNALTTGTPRYYAEFDDDTFIIAPSPSSDFKVELHYYFRPNSLTSAGDSGTTWLSTNAPNAILYGSLVEACTYLKNYEAIPVYESKFQEALLGLKNLGEAKSTRDQYRYDEIRREPQA
jgi:hypothetical protein|tara:strand:+ start:3948 stop:4598 length:651 start_codon:yes stop_codon:yes gene_type:complete